MEIKVYTKPNCPDCDSTKKQLKRFEIPFEEIALFDASGRATSAMDDVAALGFRAAPIVVVTPGINGAKTWAWSGFRYANIKELAGARR